MSLRKGLILLLSIGLAMLLSVNLNYAQEEAGVEASVEKAEAAAPKAETSSDTEIQWLWGEVVSVDAAKQQIVVKYFDYETDTEKELTIAVDNKTGYENVKSIEEIKPQDTVSVDYIVGIDGKNTAKNISVEKAEGAVEPAAPEAATEEAPAQESQE